MDKYDASNHSESQATQLFHDLLEPDTDSSRKLTESRTSALRSQNANPHEISSDSLPSSRPSNSLPQYHFHGLASTQTQSQANADEEEVNGGSQKENIGSLLSGKESGRSIPLPEESLVSLSPKQSHTRSPVEPLPAAPGGVKGTSKRNKAPVTFQSSMSKKITSSKLVPQASQSATSGHFSRRSVPRPLSRSSSKDSFASDDPEEQFLIKSKKFDVPLSQLVQDPLVQDASNATSGAPTSPMFAFSPARPRHLRSPPRGRVLVEATPSQSSKSGSSQSQDDANADFSQRSNEAQIVEVPPPAGQRFVDPEDDRGSDISEPTSSYRKLINGERDDEPDADMPATQPADEVEDTMMHNTEGNSGATPLGQWSSHISGNTAASANQPSLAPSSLLKLVNPGNQWRYFKYQQPVPSSDASNVHQNHSIAGSKTVKAPLPVLQETQPSFDEVQPKSYSHNFNQTSRTNSNRVPHSLDAPMSSPHMDVIPDSEPLRSEQFNVTMKAMPSVAKPKRKEHPKPAADDMDEGESESSSDEDERPLAAAPKLTTTRQVPKPMKLPTKGKATQETDPKNASDVKGKAPQRNYQVPVLPRKPQPKGMPAPKANRSWETGVVPSSVPSQDIENSGQDVEIALKAQLLGKKEQRDAVRSGQQPSKPSTSHKKTARKSSLAREKGAVVVANPPTDEESDESGDGTDDEYAEEVEPTGKRKRTVTSKTTRTKAVAPPKRLKRSNMSVQTRSLRSATSAAGPPTGGTRVFALWRQDGHFYSGTIKSHIAGNYYMVYFDDETEQDVNIDHIRRAELRVGDFVVVARSTRNSTVASFVDGDPERIIVQSGNDLLSLSLREIRIAHKTILSGWRDRMLTANSIICSSKPLNVKTRMSLSPSRQSVGSSRTPSREQSQILQGFGFIVTNNKGEWAKGKSNITRIIQNNGGTVVDELSSVIRMDGKHTKKSQRWTITKADVKWIGTSTIDRFLLLADDISQTPKYLMAIALGIPCVSINWLEKCIEVGTVCDWDGYLLPQGVSLHLGARLSQQVDLDWGNSLHHLQNIMDNAAPAKILAGRSVLCVGLDMVPQPKGKVRPSFDEKAQDAINAVLRIILCMGADSVEAVADLKQASQHPTNYDFVVIREAEHYHEGLHKCATVHWGWIKECLIASRFLEMPRWPSSEKDEEELLSEEEEACSQEV